MPNVVPFLDPLTNPIGFIILYFLLEVGTNSIVAILKMGLITSIITFPFTLLGSWLLPKLKEKYKTKPIVNLYLTCLIVSVVFWIILRLWYVAFGSSFIATDFISLIIMFAIMSIATFILAFIGNFILTKVYERWEMPKKLALYFIGLIMCILFWAVAWLGLLISTT